MSDKSITNYEDVLMALPNPVFVTGEGGVIRLLNTSAVNLIGGFGKKNALGNVLHEFLNSTSFIEVYNSVRRGERTEETVDFSMKNPYLLSKQYFSAHINTINAIDKKIIVVVLVDVTSERQVDKMRTDFIANVSHELRTPLSSIIGFVETLQDGAIADKKNAERFLSIMSAESNRMKRVLDDLLSLSRIEQDEHIVPMGRVNIHDILISMQEMMTPVAQAKNVSFTCALEGDLYVNGDMDQLIQVFQNLISNAIKYGNNDSVVHIRSENVIYNSTPSVKISIQDSGDGIEEKKISRLTERFYRVDKARSRQEGGTGLGLAIVKHIVGHHRGTLDIRSIVGVGSTFIVILPREEYKLCIY